MRGKGEDRHILSTTPTGKKQRRSGVLLSLGFNCALAGLVQLPIRYYSRRCCWSTTHSRHTIDAGTYVLQSSLTGPNGGCCMEATCIRLPDT